MPAEEIIDIAERLESIAQSRAAQISQNSGVSNDRYQALKYQLEVELERSQVFYDECKGQGLSIAVIDAEGYLRAMKYAQSLILQVEEWHPEK